MAPEENAFLSLLEACARLPIPEDIYVENDFVMDVIETVLNLRMLRTTVTRALAHFQAHCADQIRDFSALEDYLASQPDNLDVAKHLWGYRYRTRANNLRGLVRFFRAQGVTNAEQLKAWAERTEFEDFKGKVPGLGYAAFQWLVMRAGVQTIKPDVNIRDFVHSVTGRCLEDKQLVQLLLSVAEKLKMAPTDLDWRIWETQRKTGGSIKPRCSSI